MSKYFHNIPVNCYMLGRWPANHSFLTRQYCLVFLIFLIGLDFIQKLLEKLFNTARVEKLFDFEDYLLLISNIYGESPV